VLVSEVFLGYPCLRHQEDPGMIETDLVDSEGV
jgi:hypothetical protein